jgi:hypothetical protein
MHIRLGLHLARPIIVAPLVQILPGLTFDNDFPEHYLDIATVLDSWVAEIRCVVVDLDWRSLPPGYVGYYCRSGRFHVSFDVAVQDAVGW